MMKNRLILLCLLCLLCLRATAQAPSATPTQQTAPQPAQTTPEEEDDSAFIPDELVPKVAIYFQYSDKYMDKGLILTRAGVLHPYISIYSNHFYAGIYGILDCNSKNEPENVKHTFEKTELFVGYQRDFEDIPAIDTLSLDLRWSYYCYPHRAGRYDANGVFRRWSDGCTQELSLSLITGLPLQPGLEIFWDYEQKGVAAALTFEHSLPISFVSDKLSLDNFVELWAGNQNENPRNIQLTDKKCLRAFQLTTSLNYAYNDNVSFGPFIQMAWFPDRDYRRAVEASDINNAFNYTLGFSIFTRF